MAENVGFSVREQVGMAREVALHMGETAQGTVAVTRGIDKTSAAVQNAGAQVSRVLHSAENLARDGAAMKAEVYKFLKVIQAA